MWCTATRLWGTDTSLKAPPGTAATAGASAEGAAVTGTPAAGARIAGTHAAGAHPSRPAVVARPAAAKPCARPGDRELHVMVSTRGTIRDGLAQLVRVGVRRVCLRRESQRPHVGQRARTLAAKRKRPMRNGTMNGTKAHTRKPTPGTVISARTREERMWCRTRWMSKQPSQLTKYPQPIQYTTSRTAMVGWRGSAVGCSVCACSRSVCATRCVPATKPSPHRLCVNAGSIAVRMISPAFPSGRMLSTP